MISSAVNETSRLEGLCKTLGTCLTLSQVFVDAIARSDIVNIGEHELKGVSSRVRVFSLQVRTLGCVGLAPRQTDGPEPFRCGRDELSRVEVKEAEDEARLAVDVAFRVDDGLHHVPILPS